MFVLVPEKKRILVLACMPKDGWIMQLPVTFGQFPVTVNGSI